MLRGMPEALPVKVTSTVCWPGEREGEVKRF
jgi:hypothetical protein